MIVFDIETDGFLDQLTRVHCLCAKDLDTGEVRRFRGEGIRDEGLAYLERKTVAGHNILKFDLPALKKVYGWEPSLPFFDTLIAVRLAFADIKNDDMRKFRAKAMPGKLLGSHGLEAWGYRLGLHKGTFGKTADWKEWSQEMEDYCELDVLVTEALVKALREKNCSPLSLWLEHEFAKVIWRQETRGVAFDRPAAETLYLDLLQKRDAAGAKLKEAFGSWEAVARVFTPKRNNAKLGYVQGVPVTKMKTVHFNPASRDHIARCLQTRYGWKPTVFTDKGKPQVDEKVVKKLDYPEVPLILDYLLLAKRVGQLADGNEALLKAERNGRIHGSVNTGGAVTGRCSHSHPNLAQVPRVNRPFGKEFRSLFTASPGLVLVGCDASALEGRCLAHYMARWDGGAYGEVVLSGDIHDFNQKAAELATRDQSKTLYYAYMYGGGDEKLGSIVGGSVQEGKKLRARFEQNIPALGALVESVKRVAKARGWLRGLDGRRLHVRSQHAALNTLLQSAGALAMKQALVIADWLLQAEGLVPMDTPGAAGDYAFVLNIHDEMQCEVRPERAETVGEILAESIRAAGHFFGFRCPLDAEYKIGATWAETH